MRKITRLRSGNKNRLYYIFGIVAICSFVSIGIGYSILSSTVRVDGTASITSTWRVVFTKAIENTMQGATTTAGPSITGGTTLDIGVELNEKGSQAIYDVTVENQGTIDSYVKEIRLNDGEPTDLKVYISGIYKGFSLKAGESKQFQVIAEWSASAPESSETEKDVNVSIDFEQETDDVVKPELSMPTYTVDYPNEVWTKEKNVTMTYPEGEDLLYQYSTDGGKTWLIAPSRVYVLKYTQDGTLYIRVSDGISILTTPLITVEKIDTDAPTVNISGNDSEWTTSKTLTINASDQGSGLASNPYSWDGGKTWTSVKEKEFTSNQTVNIWVKDNVGNINKQSITINKIDNQAPTNVTLKEGSITSSSISVTASATQNQSGIRGYQFSINNGAWTSEQTSANKTFTGLTKNTSYTIKVRVYAKNGKYTDSNTITVRTNNIEVPTYDVIDNGDSKTVEITYPGTKTSNLVYQYSIDDGYSWRTVGDGNSIQYTFFESGTIIARVQDTGNNNNTVTASTLTVTIEHLTIDVLYSNVTSSEATITATVSPSTVKVNSYKFSWNGNSQTQSGNQITVYNLKKNTYQTVSVMATTSDGRQITGSVSFYTKDIPTPTYEVIDYGDSKSVIITYPGTKTDNLEYQYTIDGGQNWRQVYSGNSVQYTFTQNGTIQARVVDKGNSNNNVTAEILQITLTEKEPLTMSVSYSNVTSAGATIKATVNPTGTSIKNYQFKINNITYGTQSSNTFVVTGLTKDTLQRVSVTATATDGRTVTGSTSFYTNDIPTPTYSLRENSNGSKTVTVRYSGTKTSNLVYQYSIDNGYSWRTISGNEVQYTFTQSGTIIARVQDTDNYDNTVTAYTYTVTIEEEEDLLIMLGYSDVTSAGATIKATVYPTGTSIRSYQFTVNDTTYYAQSSNTFVATGLTKDTLQRVSVTATATDGRTVTGSTSFYTNDIPTPTYSLRENSNGSKTVTINYGGTKTDNLVYQYSINGGSSWTNVSGSSFSYTFYSDGSIMARVKDSDNSDNTVTASRYYVTFEEEEELTLNVSASSITSSGATIKATISPSGTSVTNYKLTWKSMVQTSTSGTFVLSGLPKNTYQSVSVTATTASGQQVTGSTYFYTNDIPVPTYSTTTNENGSKTVTINYGGIKTSNLVYQYSIDGGYSWRTVDYGNSVEYTFFESGTIIARVQDTDNNSNTVTASTLTVTITPADTTPPNCPSVSTSATANKWTNQNVSLSITPTSDTTNWDWYTNTNSGSFSYIDNNTGSKTKAFSTDGKHQGKMIPRDSAGNENSGCTTSSYWIDKTKPYTPLLLNFSYPQSGHYSYSCTTTSKTTSDVSCTFSAYKYYCSNSTSGTYQVYGDTASSLSNSGYTVQASLTCGSASNGCYSQIDGTKRMGSHGWVTVNDVSSISVFSGNANNYGTTSTSTLKLRVLDGAGNYSGTLSFTANWCV